MTTLNPLARNVIEVVETSLFWMPSFDKAKGKRAFQFVSHVTGKSKSEHTDYEVIESQKHFYDTVTIKGRRGYIKLRLAPLFEIL